MRSGYRQDALKAIETKKVEIVAEFFGGGGGGREIRIQKELTIGRHIRSREVSAYEDSK